MSSVLCQSTEIAACFCLNNQKLPFGYFPPIPSRGPLDLRCGPFLDLLVGCLPSAICAAATWSCEPTFSRFYSFNVAGSPSFSEEVLAGANKALSPRLVYYLVG